MREDKRGNNSCTLRSSHGDSHLQEHERNTSSTYDLMTRFEMLKTDDARTSDEISRKMRKLMRLSEGLKRRKSLTFSAMLFFIATRRMSCDVMSAKDWILLDTVRCGSGGIQRWPRGRQNLHRTSESVRSETRPCVKYGGFFSVL